MRQPKIRLPDSGSAHDTGSLCWQTIVAMKQDRWRFVENLPLLITPGYLTKPGACEAAGMPAEGGPYRVVTQQRYDRLKVWQAHLRTMRWPVSS